MSTYIENNLTKDESIVITAKKNPLYLLLPLIVMILFLVLACVVTGIYGVNLSLNYNAAAVMADKSLEMSYDKLDAEGKKEALEDAEVSSRAQLKKKMAEEAYENIKDSDFEQVELALKLLDCSVSDVIIEMIHPVIGILCWIIFAGTAIGFIKKLCTFFSLELALTNKRVIGKIGLLSKNSLDFHLDKIDHVQIKSSFLGNLLKYYSLSIASVGGAGYDTAKNRERNKELFVGIKNAQDFKEMATSAIELHAEEARKAQAEEIARAMGK